MLEVWLLVMTVVVAVWWYCKRRYSYWSSRGVLSTPVIPIVGHALESITKGTMWDAVNEAYTKNGRPKYFGRYEGFSPVLVIADPDMLRQVLVKDFDHFVDRRVFGDQEGSVLIEMLTNKTGDEWKALRSIMSPTFSSGKMRKMYPLVCKNADALVSSCVSDITKNHTIDVKERFGRFTMDTIASCAFGIECNSLTKDKPIFSQKAESFFSMTPYKLARFLIMLFIPKVFNAFGFKVDSPETDFFKDVVEQTIKGREVGQRGDFLDLLLESREEDNIVSTNTSTKQVLTDRSIVAQCVLFLIAGYDTTASTLAFTSHLLAQNPKEQQRLRQELQELVQQEGELTYQRVMEAKFLDACINETLRMYPPGALGERKCTKSYMLPGSDLTINSGDLIQFPIWSIQHDPRYWPEPEQYRPDRFMPENKADIKHFTHMPFGMGPRNCLAMRFALMEAKVALAKLILAAELQVAPGNEKIVIEKYAFVLRPQDGCHVVIKPLKEE